MELMVAFPIADIGGRGEARGQCASSGTRTIIDRPGPDEIVNQDPTPVRDLLARDLLSLRHEHSNIAFVSCRKTAEPGPTRFISGQRPFVFEHQGPPPTRRRGETGWGTPFFSRLTET